MARTKTERVEDAIAEIAALRDVPDDDRRRRALRAALSHASARVVLAAAALLEQGEGSGGWPELSAALERLLNERQPAKTDPSCRAKVGLLRAMLHLEAEGERSAYARGHRFRQLEAAWGPPVDTAAELRGLCVLGLVRSRHPDGAVFAAECLADPERAARTGAAYALREATPEAALPALRLKLAVGDPEPEVIAACFSALLELAPPLGLTVAAEMLEARGEHAETLALALGESRRPQALPLLRAFAESAPEPTQAVAFVALSLLRDDHATDYLLEVVASAPSGRAGHAVEALAAFRHDPKLKARIEEAVARRDEARFTLKSRELLARP